MREWIAVSEVEVGDVLPDPHFSGKPGKVTRVTPTWYGVAISYEYDGRSCASAVFDRGAASIEVER